jgi:hypothetical protein
MVVHNTPILNLKVFLQLIIQYEDKCVNDHLLAAVPDALSFNQRHYISEVQRVLFTVLLCEFL